MPATLANAEQSSNDSTGPSQTSRPLPLRSNWSKVLLLGVAVVAINSWTSHHLGWGLENPLGITSLAAGLGLAVTLGERLLPKDEIESLKISLAQIPATLVFLFLAAFAVLAAIRSSVLVVSDSSNGLPWDGIHLSRADTTDNVPASPREKKEEPLRFFVRTSPLGRLYRLKVPGYIEQVIQVYPLTGLTVVPERDLRLSPSVLFRPPTNALQELMPKAGGEFQVRIEDGAAFRTMKVDCNRSSYLLGSEHEIPASWLGIWDLELKGSQVSDNAGDASATKLAWYRHTLLQPPRDLAPGDVIEARVVSSGRAVVASVRVKLGNETIRDVPLVPETSPKLLSAEEIPPCPKE
jgi:hypothetical protein